MQIPAADMLHIETWLKEHHVTEVECLIPDMTGNARGKIIPADKFRKEQGMRLPEMLFIQTVTGDWPDDESMVDPREIDMFLRPDPDTLRLVPWAADPTAQIIHDGYLREGTPVDIAPRQVLRGVLEAYAKHGWRAVVAPEIEFYLACGNANSCCLRCECPDSAPCHDLSMYGGLARRAAGGTMISSPPLIIRANRSTH